MHLTELDILQATFRYHDAGIVHSDSQSPLWLHVGVSYPKRSHKKVHIIYKETKQHWTFLMSCYFLTFTDFAATVRQWDLLRFWAVQSCTTVFWNTLHFVVLSDGSNWLLLWKKTKVGFWHCNLQTKKVPMVNPDTFKNHLKGQHSTTEASGTTLC